MKTFRIPRYAARACAVAAALDMAFAPAAVRAALTERYVTRDDLRDIVKKRTPKGYPSE